MPTRLNSQHRPHRPHRVYRLTLGAAVVVIVLATACGPNPPPATTTPSATAPARRSEPGLAPGLAPSRPLGSVGSLTGPTRRQAGDRRGGAGTTVGAGAVRQSELGAVVDTRPYTKRKKKHLAIRYDLRAHLVIPVNVIRVHSDQHTADQIATHAYIKTQIQIMNRLFTLPDADMRRYGVGKPAPMMQFRLNKIYTVHERQFTRVLGFTMDTENVMMQGKSYNGHRLANTWDVRSVKIKGETTYLTVYYTWRGRSGHTVGRWGGVSNVGFADMARPRSAGILTKVTGRRAYMGPILFRLASPATMAHEVGHYFDLPHAWKRLGNQTRKISDLGSGAQNNVDGRPGVDNVMDYGRASKQYLTRHQLRHMYQYALKKAPELITVFKTRGGPAPRPLARVRPGPDPRPRPQPRPQPRPVVVSKPMVGTIGRVWVDPPTPGSKVAVHLRFAIKHGQGAGRVVAWFTDRTGQALRDTDGRFRTRAGQVAMGADYTARGANKQFADFRLTLPAGQLHLSPGKHALRVVVGLFHRGRHLAKKRVDFDYRVKERPRRPAPVKNPAAWIKGVKVKPNVAFAGAQYVRLLVNLTTDHLKGQPVQLEARFYFTDGRVLRDHDQRYRSKEGHALATGRLVPKYARSRWTNVSLRMPIRELHLQRGQRVTLTAAVTVKSGGKTLASKISPRFVVAAAGTRTTTPRPAVSRTATIKKVWVIHRVKKGGKLGLAVKARLEVKGHKGHKLRFTAWFYDKAGKSLPDKDRRYATPQKKVAASVTIKPLYDNAVFPSCTVFIPYAQLHLPAGQHRVQVAVGVSKGGRKIAKRSKPMGVTVNPRTPPKSKPDPWEW